MLRDVTHHLQKVVRINLFEERLTHSVIGAFFDVYNTLGFGFLEHIYVMALERELLARNHRVAREVAVQVSYKGQWLGQQRLDMIVDEKLVVETKSTQELHKSAHRQYTRPESTDSNSTSRIRRSHAPRVVPATNEIHYSSIRSSNELPSACSDSTSRYKRGDCGGPEPSPRRLRIVPLSTPAFRTRPLDAGGFRSQAMPPQEPQEAVHTTDI